MERKTRACLWAWCGAGMMAALSVWVIGSQLTRQATASQAPLEIGPVPGAPLEIDGRPAPTPSAKPSPAPAAPPVAPGRIDFELRTNQSRYLTPEIAFGISRIDEARQRVSAWLRFSSDQKTLWLEDRSALHPLSVSSPRTGETIEIVLTRVTHDRVTGYLRLPSEVPPPARSARLRPRP